MSQKVIVTQCPEHNGTMYTVRFAPKLRQGNFCHILHFI